jgi:hypothetical protein
MISDFSELEACKPMRDIDRTSLRQPASRSHPLDNLPRDLYYLGPHSQPPQFTGFAVGALESTAEVDAPDPIDKFLFTKYPDPGRFLKSLMKGRAVEAQSIVPMFELQRLAGVPEDPENERHTGMDVIKGVSMLYPQLPRRILERIVPLKIGRIPEGEILGRHKNRKSAGLTPSYLTPAR